MPEKFYFNPLFIRYVLGILLMGVGFWLYEVLRGARAIQHRLERPQVSWIDVGLFVSWLLAFLYVGQHLVALAYRSWIRGHVPAIWDQVVIGFSTHVCVLLFVALVCRFYPQLLGGHLSRPESRKLSALSCGFYSFFVALPLIWFTGILWHLGMWLWDWMGVPIEVMHQEAIDLFVASDVLSFRVCFVLFAVLIAPIAEELVFRAGVYRLLKGKWNARLAMVVSAVLFAGIHANIFSFLPLVLIGMLLVRAYERTGSILTPIVFHCLFNANTLVMLMLQPSVLELT